MRTFTLFILVLLTGVANSQLIYDFSVDPLVNGWNYYDDYSSLPYPGFSHDVANENIEYSLINETEISFLHTQLPNALGQNYCVSFKITPTNASNYNSFFPLLLTPVVPSGSDLHPWRQNAPSSSTAGPHQNLDLIGVEALGLQVRFVHRDNDIVNSTTIQAFSSPFYMVDNQDYWIKLTVTNSTNAELAIYQDATFSNLLASQLYTIPVLSNMNHLYIANCNGNSSTIQYGLLDEYRINDCEVAGITAETVSGSKKLVKIIDLMGRDTQFKPNTTLIFMYSDGTCERVMQMD